MNHAIRIRLAPSLVGLVVLAACGRSQSAQPLAAVSIAPQASAAALERATDQPRTTRAAKLAVSFPEGGAHLPLWWGVEQGVFGRYGLAVTLQPLGGGAGALAALQRGETQIADMTGSVIAAANAQGSDLVALATLNPVFPYVLVAPEAIQTPEDLKGKGIAVRAPGDGTDIAARMALQQLGLVPDRDVRILAVNTAEARMAAVKAGKICCTVAQPQDEIELASSGGYHVLFDFSTLGLPNAQGVIATPRSYAKANRATVQAFMDALVESIAASKRDRAASQALFKKYLKLDDDSTASVLFDYFAGKVIPSNPRVSAAQFTDGITVLAQTNDRLSGFTMDAFIDTSFLERSIEKLAPQ